MESVENHREDSNAVHDRKSIWKHLKQQMKEAKKLKKEEEFLANLRKPKSTKVVLADRKFVEKLRNQNAHSGSSQTPGFLARDFPALSASGQFSKSPSKSKEPLTYNKAVNNSAAKWHFPPIQKDIVEKPEQRNDSDTLPSSSAVTETVNVPPELPVDAAAVKPINLKLDSQVEPHKRTKKADPIVLNIGDLISKKPSKNDKKHVVYGSKYRRVPEAGVLCGNMLDSSNPKRKRGKYRENKKVKLSKLKMAIIRDRILKQKGIYNSNITAEVMDRKQLKIEIDEYLSNLMKKKLELAEKRRALAEENKTEQVIPNHITLSEPSEGKMAKKKQTKYRKYCDNSYTEDLDKSVRNLITGIVYLQDRAFKKDQIKANAKKRHVVGFREVKKYLTLKKVKMIVMAPDLEAKDAVCDVVEDLKKAALLQNVPCVFALSRRMLGFVTKKTVPVSAFGILNYDGLEDRFAEVKEHLKEAQDKYNLNRHQTEVKKVPLR